ncbi:hypothetical protein [uncultured Bilophila sp.]|uniref:hypothetical protein n=1 Tax=uncultured Bilophila sp. TaxID=529385 RepID=UPI0026707C02|nr:hypothetical protein [uncultured Bilophila sp.]
MVVLSPRRSEDTLFFSFFVGGHYAWGLLSGIFWGLQGIKLQSFPAVRPQAPFSRIPFFSVSRKQ